MAESLEDPLQSLRFELDVIGIEGVKVHDKVLDSEIYPEINPISNGT